jgi:hypothetical protein
MQRSYEFEDLVADFFERRGYNVTREVRLGGLEFDLLVELYGRRTPIEVSAPGPKVAIAKLRLDAERLLSLRAIEPDLGPAMIIMGTSLTPEAKAWSESQWGLHVWGLDDLVEQVREYPDLAARAAKFGSSRPPPDAAESSNNHKLRRALAAHIKENKLSPAEYETLCMSVFVELFDPDLYGFEKQASTTDGGNRYDFICRIQGGNVFWDTLRQDFRTKAILFECKNYNQQIGPDQIYSTERYLFVGALRTVCILISRLGANDGAIRAAQGAMRESGKLIVLLSNADLITMLELKTQPGAAENFIDKRIWDFVVSLPR